ncbi:MAG: CRISPR-associated helicase Cas3' [Eubacteriales bacterium]|nr:CRISPR-associated helicase Cas3' [Eubacteriales bacterium]
MELRSFWAKSAPKMSVTTHGKIAGIAAQILFDNMLSDGTAQLLSFLMQLEREKLRQFVGYLVSLHDIGKIEYHFQAQDEQLKERLIAEQLCPAERLVERYRHEKTTEQILRKTIWTAQGYDKRTVRFYAAILGAHHQGKEGSPSPYMERLKDYQIEYEQEMRQYFFKSDANVVLPEVQKEDKGTVGAILLGLTVLADWISSSDYFEKADDCAPDFEKIPEKIHSFLEKSGLNKVDRIFGDTFSEVWPEFPAEQMRPLQKEVEKLFQKAQEKVALVLLEAPMGEGKTEAGCYAAVQMGKQYQKNGIYFALPTAATSNQMVGRMRNWLRNDVRLLHGMAWMEETDAIPEGNLHIDDDEEHAETARNWLAPVRRGLLSQYAVGTIDQAMMAAMLIKYGCLRLLGLSGKVLLIDELHAYDMYMGTIVERLLDWCKALEIPVVLLSATLTQEKKQQMLRPYTEEPVDNAYPAITAVTQSGKLLVRPVTEITRRQTVQIELLPILHQPQRIALQAMQLTENGGCLCVMLNTVKQAQEVYQAIQTIGFDGEMLLFHARFPAERRDEIEKNCLRLFGKDKTHRPRKAIVVATQVVEQSLDVDFDIFMSSVAPIDLLLQRTGREFRHEETRRPAGIKTPTFYIMIPEDGAQAEDTAFAADGWVYPTCLLRQSIHVLQNRKTIRIPEDMAQLVADGYDEEKAPSEYLESWWETKIDDQLKAQRSEPCCLSHPKIGFDPVQKKLTKDKFPLDDAETDSYFSAKTRLGEPTVRIALIGSELYETVRKWNAEKQYIPQALAREVLKQSVSVLKKQVADILTSGKALKGSGLLFGVTMFPSDDGIFEENGMRIVCDPILGVCIEHL